MMSAFVAPELSTLCSFPFYPIYSLAFNAFGKNPAMRDFCLDFFLKNLKLSDQKTVYDNCFTGKR